MYFIFDILLFQVKFRLCYSDKIEETDTLVSVNTIYVNHLSCHRFLDEVILNSTMEEGPLHKVAVSPLFEKITCL